VSGARPDIGANTKLGKSARSSAGSWGLPGLILVLSLAGIGVASYLTYSHWLEESVACGGYGGCDTVAESEYARVSGIPVAFIGLLGYAAILGMSGLWLRTGDRFGEMPPLLVWGMALAGTAYSLYLTYLEVFVIDAVCLWCLASAVIMTCILLISTVAVARARREI
jgi:uncharacterized membrane protein